MLGDPNLAEHDVLRTLYALWCLAEVDVVQMEGILRRNLKYSIKELTRESFEVISLDEKVTFKIK